jgi:hypothetical protein
MMVITRKQVDDLHACIVGCIAAAQMFNADDYRAPDKAAQIQQQLSNIEAHLQNMRKLALELHDQRAVPQEVS